jgi:DNA modification methylase
MWEIREGDNRKLLAAMPDQSIQTCITSPPYWGLRDYGHDDQLGGEETPELFVANLVAVFAEVRRVLRDDGTLWLNLGDTYCSTAPGTVNAPERIAGAGGRDGERGAARAQYRAPTPPGMKPKDLVGIPWMVAFALRADGWYLRSEIIWAKPNPMPESVTDRPTKAHEQVFLLTKSARYFYDADAVAEELAPASVSRLAQDVDGQTGSDRVPGKTNGPMKAVGPRFGGYKYGDDGSEQSRTKNGNVYTGESGRRNKRTVWTVATQPFKGAHFATFPPKLIEPMILAGSKPGDTVLDPFSGSGTTGVVALRHDRSYVGLELNPEYAELSRNRIRDDAPLLNTEPPPPAQPEPAPSTLPKEWIPNA